MTSLKDQYRILGLEPDATISEVKKAYRHLAMVWHPDRFSDPELRAKAGDRLSAINQAYEAICQDLGGDPSPQHVVRVAAESFQNEKESNGKEPGGYSKSALWLLAGLAVALFLWLSQQDSNPPSAGVGEPPVFPPEDISALRIPSSSPPRACPLWISSDTSIFATSGPDSLVRRVSIEQMRSSRYRDYDLLQQRSVYGFRLNGSIRNQTQGRIWIRRLVAGFVDREGNLVGDYTCSFPRFSGLSSTEPPCRLEQWNLQPGYVTDFVLKIPDSEVPSVARKDVVSLRVGFCDRYERGPGIYP